MRCRSVEWAMGIGADWEECRNDATHTLRYVPTYVRVGVMAARTVHGYVDSYDVCEGCALIIKEMCEEEGEMGRWVAIDGEPNPFGEE